MPKVILISQRPLPFPKIDSWPTLYKNYLQADHKIDYIICSPVANPFPSVIYGFVKRGIYTKLLKKWKKNSYLDYLKALKSVIEPNQKYIIQIVDNFGIVKPLVDFLNKLGIRNQMYLQFCYHGYPPFYGNFEARWFFHNIDEMILLTHDSYIAHKNSYTILPTRFSVLHNGIDTTKFFRLSSNEKQNLQNALGYKEKKIFVWCSQDRPKKGLHLILSAWKKVHSQYPETVLWVIGTENNLPQDGVVFLGKIPNDQLPNYYQAAHCYLYPTLCHEGFGLSLIEALHSGCYCIASSIGGVPEVLQYGKLGKLIENPHFEDDWIKAIIAYLNAPIQFDPVPKELYTTENWNLGMNNIIEKAKSRLL